MTKARDIASAAPAPSTVSATELGYVDGVTSAIQTQLDGKSGTSHNHDSNYIAKTLTTTTGDLIYASSANTPARLGIGSTNQVLTVSGGVPSWATPATPSSGMTKIDSGTFSASGNVILEGKFTTTYKRYRLVMQYYTSVANTNCYMRCRYGSANEQATSYYSAVVSYKFNGVSDSSGVNGGTAIFIGSADAGGYHGCLLDITFANLGSTSNICPFWSGTLFQNYPASAGAIGGYLAANRTNYDGVNFYPNSGTITGSYTLYGLAD